MRQTACLAGLFAALIGSGLWLLHAQQQDNDTADPAIIVTSPPVPAAFHPGPGWLHRPLVTPPRLPPTLKQWKPLP